MQTKLYKIPKFDVNRPKSKEDTVQSFENVKIYKEMYGHPDAVRHSIHFFITCNFDDFKSLYLSRNQPD